MANRAVDLLITYRIVKLLTTPFDRQEAFKRGIIDNDGKVLKKNKDLVTAADKNAYTILHRFCFNLKRIMHRFGFKSQLSSFAITLALFLKENKEYEQHQQLIERSVIKYLRETNQYEKIFNEETRVIKESKETPVMTCFGVDIYNDNGKLVTEYEIV